MNGFTKVHSAVVSGGVYVTQIKNLKVLILTEYYPQYLKYFYEKHPSVVNLSFEEHRKEIFEDHFGWPAELSEYMNQQGIQTEFIIANAESLQKKWAEENEFRSYSIWNWKKEIAMEQIKCFQPDILWVDSIFDYYGRFVKDALKYSKKAITWVGSPFIEKIDVSGFSVLLTENPNTFKSIQNQFEKVIITKPGFDPEVLKKIGSVEKKYDVTFVGGISASHTKRAEVLAYLIKNGINIKVFGYLPPGKLKSIVLEVLHILKHRNLQTAISTLKQTFVKTDFQRNVESIKSVHQVPVFGLDMYRTMAASRITLNIHIDVVGKYAGNMRMFESTGIGTCLLAEHSESINELFEPGKEILTFNSKEDLLEIIQKLLNDNEKIEQIAKAGQKRVLQCHTLERMFNDIKPAFDIS